MKKLFLYVTFILTITTLSWGSYSYGMTNIPCNQSGSIVGNLGVYENIYHKFLNPIIAHKIYAVCVAQNEVRKFYWNHLPDLHDGPWEDTTLAQIIPIYHPQQNIPILVQLVSFYKNKYQMMISQPIRRWLGIKEICDGVRLSDGWLSTMCTDDILLRPERKNIYLLSQQEPYKSAPQIQFYIYKVGMLLVARDKTGLITHWDYERKNISVTEKQIRYYLGDKWYHP